LIVRVTGGLFAALSPPAASAWAASFSISSRQAAEPGEANNTPQAHEADSNKTLLRPILYPPLSLRRINKAFHAYVPRRL
jgi:hypothetical protein